MYFLDQDVDVVNVLFSIYVTVFTQTFHIMIVSMSSVEMSSRITIIKNIFTTVLPKYCLKPVYCFMYRLF